MTDAQQTMYDEIVACFDECQGMVRNSAQETARYRYLAEKLLAILGEAIREPVMRIAGGPTPAAAPCTAEDPGLLARANCLLLCCHPIVARSSDQGLRGAIAHHLRDRPVGFDDREPPAPWPRAESEAKPQKRKEGCPHGIWPMICLTCDFPGLGPVMTEFEP